MDEPYEPNPMLETVTHAVRALLRTERTVRTYPIDNELSRQALAELGPRLEPALPLDLEVHRDQLVWNGHPLIREDRDRSELPTRLYRDGVRRLRLVQGLTEAELRRFIVALSTPIHPDDLSEDYVTTLWAADLSHVRVMAIDPYLDIDVPEEVLEGPEQRPSEEVEEVGPLPQADDVPPPPEEAFRITQEDREQIAQEVERAESCPPWSAFIGALFDLIHQADSNQRIEELVRLLEATFHRLLKDGLIDVASELHLRLQSKLPRAAELPIRQALERMAHPERLRELNDALDADRVSPEAAERLLILLGDRVPDALCALLCSATGDRTRRLYVEVLAKIGLPVLEPALQGLLSAPPDAQPHFVRLLGKLKDSRATGALIATLRNGDAGLRKEVLRSLAAVNDERARASTLKTALRDTNASVRVTALRCLGAQGAQLGSRNIIARLSSPEFGSFPEEEKDLLFAALGAVGTQDAIAFLEERLRPAWVPGRSDSSTWRRAAQELARIEAPGARAVLEKHASGRNRDLAKICADALHSRRGDS